MSMHESSLHKTYHHKHERSNANEVPLGTRKRSHEKNKSYIHSNLASPKRRDTPATQNTISNSLRQIRNTVSNEKIPIKCQKNATEVSDGKANRDVLQNKKPSIKDRLGQVPRRGRSNNSDEINDYHKNNQYSGRGQRGGHDLGYRGYAHGPNTSPYQRGRGRGGFRGRGTNLSLNQSCNEIEDAFPDSNIDVCKAYPIPMGNDMLHKMRPRSVRRAAAQIQTLFDSSLTFSSPAIVTDCRKGMTGPVISPAVQESLTKVINRRKYKTKDCEECSICSNVLFQVCHPHISTVQLIRSQQHQLLREQEKQMVQAQNLSIIETDTKIWCPICRRRHNKGEMGSILLEDCSKLFQEDYDNGEIHLAPPGEEMSQSKLDWQGFSTPGRLIRRKLVMSSTTLNNVWTTKSYNHAAKFHVDFDCIVGGQIHDVHASFLYQYGETKEPINIVVSCGVDNIVSGDTSWSIIFQLNSFVRSILQHSKDNKHEVANRILICPILYAPKYCDNRLPPEENMLQKVIEVNRWIHKFNMDNTGLKINLDNLGILQIPNGLCGVKHDYGKWSESSWQDKVNLTQDAKENISQELLHVFETLDHQSYMLGKYKDVRQSKNKSVTTDLKSENTVENKNIPIIVSKAKSEKTKELKPPGVDEDDESDEDLSYLL